MNFIETFHAGQAGKNIGLPTGITPIDKSIGGIQRGYSYGIAAAPKVGKTTFVDFAFVLSPYLYSLQNKSLDNIDWVYFSFEIDRISKEYKFAAFFMAHEYDIYHIYYKDKMYLMSQDYLMGRLQHQNPDGSLEMIPIEEAHKKILIEIYQKHITTLFGEFARDGSQIKAGKIDFIEESENPTGINKYLITQASKEGEFIVHKYMLGNEERSRIIGYKPNNTEKIKIVITDHIRKPQRERGFTTKENIDKLLEYHTKLRNICKWTLVDVCHSNRQVSNIDRLKFAGEFIYPTADDVKDTGNLAEESTILFTLFNPNDEKYNLKKHFGVELENYPNYRSIHIAESRYTECPMHFQANMLGGVNMFTPLNFQS